jgi:hypothetical protein
MRLWPDEAAAVRALTPVARVSQISFADPAKVALRSELAISSAASTSSRWRIRSSEQCV